jgi:hypothetical protein
MSPDWAANPEAVPYSKLDNPQSLNLYQYVLKNPLSQKDDDGHEIIYADGLKNSQLVRDSVTAVLAHHINDMTKRHVGHHIRDCLLGFRICDRRFRDSYVG